MFNRAELRIYVATQTNESPDGDRIEIFVSDMPGNVTHEGRKL